MKLKEPFAGFEQGQGHFSYHLAFFIAGWSVTATTITPEEELVVDESITSAIAPIQACFFIMRWSHFISFAFDGIAILAESQVH
jgi:hypothetical protein